MADIVNERYQEAQALIKARAQRFKDLVEQTKGKNFPRRAEFDQGMQLLEQLIQNESQLLDKAIFEMPKITVEQMRNLHLTTGYANQTVPEGMSSATNAIDSMLKALEEMAKTR